MTTFAELLARGVVQEHINIGAMTTYRVGGSARYFIEIDSHELAAEAIPIAQSSGLPMLVLGNGSNLLVADGEHEVIALHLSGELAEMSTEITGDDVTVFVGAGMDLPIAARRLASEGITGFEWAVGVPGTFGGAVAMNAGGHGSDMAASVRSANVWREGQFSSWGSAQLSFGYRHSALEPGDVVTEVVLSLSRGDAQESKNRLSEIVRWRREHQPGGQNAGSVFRNPEGQSAGELIERSGLKGERIGGASVSFKHANFIQVDEGARASDVAALIQRIHSRVLETTGVNLLIENRYFGFGASR
jgi:UDP-N-acetylmuramate dehydrogenase